MGIKQTILKIRNKDFEKTKILKMVKQYAGENGTVLDVGCGYGRNLEFLHKAGVNTMGIDINPDTVAAVRANGFNSCTLEEFNDDESKQGPYDVILMSHIIEHFTVGGLMEFLDYYLGMLKVGGHLVIATPLLTRYFYDDFDHVKPYHPKGILMFYGKAGHQVSRTSQTYLDLVQLEYKKGIWRLVNVSGKYVSKWYSKILYLAETISALLFIMTCGCFGERDGWIGAFKKTSA